MKLKTNTLAYLAANSPDKELRERCTLLIGELADPDLATTVTKGSQKKVGWKCSAHGHEWEATVANRRAGRGCPACSGRRVLSGLNDLATTHPELAAELVSLKLGSTLVSGTHRKVAWKCSAHGHEWEATVANRAHRGSGCPTCAGRQVLVRFNDIASTRPDLAAELADPTLASTITKNSNKKVGWRCELGHKWRTSANLRTSGNGCPTCSKTGFKPDKPGYLYLLRAQIDSVTYTKVGITNVETKRSRTDMFENAGFTVVEKVRVEDGVEAQALEGELLSHLTNTYGNPVDKSSFETAFPKALGGHTETWVEQPGMRRYLQRKFAALKVTTSGSPIDSLAA